MTELKTQIIEYLSGLAAFEATKIVASYPEKQRAFPLGEPVITVEAGGVELVSAGLGGYLGGSSPLYGASAVISLRLGIFCPTALECSKLFERLCNALFDFSRLSLQKITCERPQYDAKTAAFILEASAEIKSAWVVPSQEERLFNEICLKETKL